jgi:uncharacterized protein (DUF2141 family)
VLSLKKGMQLIIVLIFGLLASTCSPANREGNAAGKGNITIKIENGQSTTGKVRVALFDNKQAFNKSKGALTGKVISPAERQAVFTDIPYGVYAIAAYHDLNDNGQLDKNMLGIPTEPYAFSNNPVVKWEAPTYEEARFELEQATLELSLTLKFWKDY